MDSCDDILVAGLAELSLDLNTSQIERLLAFIALIEKWNKAYNLTAVRERQAMVALHLLDSVAILPHLQGLRIADIGTGAGLPGIPLAICRPDWEFVLLDANSKKTRFVQQAILELKLPNVQVQHQRVELFQPKQPFDTVVSRAFAAMPDILNLCRHLLAPQGWLVAMKGQAPHDELSELALQYDVIPVRVPGIDAERCLVRLQGKLHG